MIHLLSKKISTPERFWNTRAPNKFFRYCQKENISTEIRNNPHPSYPYIFFYTTKVLKHRRVTFEFFRPCEKRFSTKNSHTIFLTDNFFDPQMSLKHWMAPPRKLSALWDKKNLYRKMWRPLLMYKFFRYPNSSETMKGVPGLFSALWDKRKVSADKIDVPFLCAKVFDTEYFWNIEWFLHKSFRHCELEKVSTEICDIALCKKFFDTRIFRKQWRFPHEVFQHG